MEPAKCVNLMTDIPFLYVSYCRVMVGGDILAFDFIYMFSHFGVLVRG